MKYAAALITAVTLLAGPAQAADRGKVLDELTQAISGQVTMSAENKVAAMRAATRSYDACMAGDKRTADETREALMAQVRRHLGGK